MENNNNRWFYNEYDSMEKEYKKDKKNFIRFIIRIDEDLHEIFRSIDGFSKMNTCQKSSNALERDRTELYDFDIMKYDNSKAKDMIAHISICVCSPNDKDIISTKIKEKFSSSLVKMSNAGKGKAVTTHIGIDKSIRGTWYSDSPRVNKYPICILSYKRSNECGFSHMCLTKLKIRHYLFIEIQEKEAYEKWFDPTYCELVISNRNFSIEDKMGSTPMRNFIIEWGKKWFFDKVWMLDDNIKNYVRFYQGDKNNIECNEIFTSIEDYVDRYNNVGVVSHNFAPFITEGDCRTCIVKNGKCYSSMLVPTNNDIRFRYKHQEDNLISIEYICKGYTTLCFNHIQYSKDTSGKNKGGNKEGIYKVEGKDGDGKGYQERYEYFECVLRILKMEGKLKLKEGKTVKDLLSRSTRMVSKEYHADVEYSVLQGCCNDISKKDTYRPIRNNDLKFVKR